LTSDPEFVEPPSLFLHLEVTNLGWKALKLVKMGSEEGRSKEG